MALHVSEPLANRDAGVETRNRAHTSALSQPTTNLRQAFLGGFGRVEALEKYGMLAARILISHIFLLSGIMKIMDPAKTAEEMAGRGMILIPFFLWSAVAVELVGGLSLLLGFKTRLGALLLFLFLIPVTLIVHNFWTYPPEEQQTQMFMLMHNVTHLGALLLLMAVGPGPLSIDARKARLHD